jgi:hypothetical protein
MDIWKDITGYVGFYQVSNLGKVKSLRRGIILKPALRGGRCGGSYNFVVLCVNSVRSNVSVHRLVAEAFVGNPNSLPEVDHIDEDKGNNTSTNLEWTTRQGNTDHSKRSYTFLSPEGVKVEVKDLYRFCELHSLHKGHMCEVHSGKTNRKSHKGWRVFPSDCA